MSTGPRPTRGDHPGGVLRAAFARIRARRGRAALGATGIAAAAAMLGTAVTLGYGLGGGFERAAERADLPDAIARFDDERLGEIDRRVRALPNLEARSYRLEFRGVPLSAGGRRSERGRIELVRPGRRGYAVVEGRDLSGRGDELVVERGLASEWGLEVGDTISIADSRPIEVVGIAVSPDNVAFPLAAAPRVYAAYDWVAPLLGLTGDPVNVALVWARDPARLDVTLAQARASGFGIDNLRFVTREGVQVLLDQAAGIVIALLVAFSFVALGSAAVMLGASARADVERRLESIGVMRALGFSRAAVTREYALEAVLVALPAAALGLAAGALLASGPTARLLESLNELPPGLALVPLLLVALVGVVAIVALATAWPAWRAAGRPPAEVMRGSSGAPAARSRRGASGPRLAGARGGLGWPRSASRRGLRWLRRRASLTATTRTPARRGTVGPGSGPLALGARLAIARRGRAIGTVAVLGVSIAVVVLMLALASLFERLQSDPGVLGKRYDLTARLPPAGAGAVRAVDGVAAASPRYAVEASDAFNLAESVRMVAYPDDPAEWERSPMAEGRRVLRDGEAVIGSGLSSALGVRPGGTLAALLPSGAEVRLRVVGVVRALENDGRVAYARSRPLLAADPTLESTIAIRLEPGADRAAVTRALEALGATPEPVGGATSRNARFLGVLADLLRVVAAVNGLVCLYALVQALALLALERRSSLAVLRASGAGRAHVALVLGGAAALAVGLATPVGVVLERLLLAPLVARIAAAYASLPLAPRPADLALVLVGTGALALAATGWVAFRLGREPIVAGLREE